MLNETKLKEKKRLRLFETTEMYSNKQQNNKYHDLVSKQGNSCICCISKRKAKYGK